MRRGFRRVLHKARFNGLPQKFRQTPYGFSFSKKSHKTPARGRVRVFYGGY
jgi:hypothetical protein